MAEKKIEITGASPHIGSRLDRFIADAAELTRSRAKKIIEDGLVSVNGEIRSAHYGINPGDIVVFSCPEDKAPGASAIPLDLNIIYEDKSFVVIDKPAGLVVHPAPGCSAPTLLNGLAARYPFPEIVHRLDKDTSGVMVAALNPAAALDLRKQFKDRAVRKVYLAIARGRVSPEAGEIDAPIRRSRRDPTKMSVGWARARKSLTGYRVIGYSGGASFLEAHPLSGRTHQIRIHFSHLGYPLLGDSKYGEPGIAPRQMLHAHSISFSRPGTSGILKFTSALPGDFKSVLAGLGFSL